MNKKIPMRLCIGCGQMYAKKEMLRIVRDSDGELTIDTTGKKNGRGAYICKEISCFELVKAKKGLERSFKRSITKQIYDSLIKEFENLNES